jgi:hypothetical protein
MLYYCGDSRDLTKCWSDPRESITDLSRIESFVHPSQKPARIHYKDEPLNFFKENNLFCKLDDPLNINVAKSKQICGQFDRQHSEISSLKIFITNTSVLLLLLLET